MKRLTALTIAVLMILSIFSLSVSADETEERMTKQEYYAAQSYLIAKYKDGDISYSEFQQQTQAVTDEYITNNTIGGELQAGALNASNTFNAVAQKIGNTVQKYGEAFHKILCKSKSKQAKGGLQSKQDWGFPLNCDTPAG